MQEIVKEISKILIGRGLTLSIVESATGGLLSHSITNYAGCSAYYLGSVTSYSNEVKEKIICVSARTLEEKGAVSEEVALQMADGGRKLFGASVCIADTGIAGPGGATENKPLGLFYIGLSKSDGTEVKKYIFEGTREEIKQKAALEALKLLLNYLNTLG